MLEVDIDKAFDIGVAGHLGGQFGPDGSEATLFGATGFGGDSSVALPADPTAFQGLFLGLQGPTIDIPIAGGESLTIPSYGSTFRALQTNGTINLLSTPNILTSDNMEAEIVVGEVVPFITAQGRDINNQPINQIQRENVALTLRLTPQINESDDVTLDVYHEIQDIIPGPDIEQFGPTTAIRSTRSTVLVKHAQTITIAGLISDRELNSVSKVPILGDIPLLGWLFKSKTKSKRKTSLAIFLTPHIVREPEDLQQLSIQKNLRRQRFLKENNMPDHPGLKRYELDKELQAPLRSSTRQEPLPANGEVATEDSLPIETHVNLPVDSEANKMPLARTAPPTIEMSDERKPEDVAVSNEGTSVDTAVADESNSEDVESTNDDDEREE